MASLVFREIQAEAADAGGLGIVRIFSDGALKRCYGVEVIALAIIGDAKFVRDFFVVIDLEISFRR